MTDLLELLTRELQVLELGSKLQSQVSSEINKTQREYYLREQMKAIQKELGEGDERGEEIDELRKKIDEAQHARRGAEGGQPRAGPPAAHVAGRAGVHGRPDLRRDWLVALPWDESTPDNLDIPEVKQVLDDDHYGLEKIKDRILEYLSVRKFKPEGDLRQPILCFVGPPGVGKTSLAKSIAKAMGKKFVRISPGRRPRRGRDPRPPAHLHRRAAGPDHPGHPAGGDATTRSSCWTRSTRSARTSGATRRRRCWKCWTRSRTATFRDNYLDVPFDLSNVLFVTTANMLDTIQPALRDRMEIIELSGYTEEEKVADRRPPSGAQAARRARPDRGAADFTDGGRQGRSSGATPARRASAAWSARSPRSAARRPASSPRAARSR